MRRIGLAVMAALATASCAGQDGEAFPAAKAAVGAAVGNPATIQFEDLKLLHLTGLKGSTADVVCGDVAKDAKVVPSHFIYIWKLKPAVPHSGRTAGETMVFPVMDRRAVHELQYFCTENPDRSTANDYDYFN